MQKNVKPADGWRRDEYEPRELAEALLAGRVAGTVTSHDRHNVRWKVKRLVEGDPESQFGLSGIGGLSPNEVLELVGEEAGFDADPLLRDEPVPIDPWKVLASCSAAGERLAAAAARGERVVVATGHPVGLRRLYQSVVSLLEEHGAKVLTPADGARWRHDGKRRELRYRAGVGVVCDWRAPIHTHWPHGMRRILEAASPDLVLADHGLAGAAIEAGVETIGIADINDPALVVAKHRGRVGLVVVMDDNVRPEAYWPCFQAMASRFP